jgi:hypothetical protein
MYVCTCLLNTDDHGGVGGGVAFGIGGHDGGESVSPGDGDGGGAEPVELGEDAEKTTIRSDGRIAPFAVLLQTRSIDFGQIFPNFPESFSTRIVAMSRVTRLGENHTMGDCLLWEVFRKLQK